jgi:acetoin utilization deacetylase AcuC-like enzyme/GNAT superfamily N-acetyltransferase
LFRIRRIHDDVLPVNRTALHKVQLLLCAQFPGVPSEDIDALPAQLRDPLKSRFRRVVFVAENRHGVLGGAVLMHAPDLKFCFLDYIASAPGQAGGGVGGALYERVREECQILEVRGLFFECLPDEAQAVSKLEFLEDNRARLRFYEGYGARPIVNTAYESPVKEGDSDLPHLVYDDLGTKLPLRRAEARLIVRAILERKYAWLCPPAYVEKVVRSFKDDPVELRQPRYTRAAPPAPAGFRTPKDLRILLVINDKHDIHHVRERGYVESPIRVGAIKRDLDKLDLFETVLPQHFSEEFILQVHDADFVRYLERMCKSLQGKDSVYPYVFPIRNPARPPKQMPLRAGYFCIDTFTPLHQNAWPAARRAVDCALTGAKAIIQGRRLSYVLVRPPGHHAERRVFGGFCYLNSAAVAANYLSAYGSVAMLDVDYHHGNGQQDIFYRRGDVLTVSIHGDPRFAYPYFTGFADEVGEDAGRGFNLNLPLEEKVDGNRYSRALSQALSAVTTFAPSFLVVCLGFDTAKADPTGSWSLAASDFERNGRAIGALGLPTLVVQEGGYKTRTLGINARHFFRGLWDGAVQAEKTKAIGKRAAKRV